MAFFDRAGQILRAKADPERELRQMLAAMQNELLLLREATASAIALQKRNERQQSQEETLAESFLTRAKVALARRDEPLAREFLAQRHARLKNARALQQDIAQQSEVIQQMRTRFSDLEQKLSAALSRQEQYAVRARCAEATRRLYNRE